MTFTAIPGSHYVHPPKILCRVHSGKGNLSIVCQCLMLFYNFKLQALNYLQNALNHLRIYCPSEGRWLFITCCSTLNFSSTQDYFSQKYLIISVKHTICEGDNFKLEKTKQLFNQVNNIGEQHGLTVSQIQYPSLYNLHVN